jgi:type IV pilus assembly protein PilF
MISRARLIALSLSLLLGACVTEKTNNNPNITPNSRPKADMTAAAKANTQLGLAYASQGNLELALAKLRKAVDQDSSIAQAHAGLGYIYWKQGDAGEAQNEYQRAIDLDPVDPDIRNNYGVFLCSQRRYDEGDRNFMLALKNHDYSTPAQAWTNAGLCARQAGDQNRSDSDFREALRIDPNFPEALQEMASNSYKQQNYQLTQSLLDRYFKVGAQNPSVLLLAMHNQQALGNDDGARRYELKLIREYPESDEVAQLLKQRSATTSP